MIEAGTSWIVLVFMALTLGIRHGFDLDHLATIDAITRTTRSDRLLSKFVGFFFSLGHGIVVIAVSLLVSNGILQDHIPDWLDGLGHWISIFFLCFFGILNLFSIFRNPTKEPVPAGIKSYLFKKIGADKFNPLMIMAVGALFAFSFDTFSQAALFAISATLTSGWLLAGMLAFVFTLGMMLSDGINGLLVSTVIQKADGASVVFSQVIGLLVCAFSLGVAFMSLYELFFAA